ncbi:LOW QUALITY PROTEIN: hypothetical protein ACHAW5_000939 [Stephanodiscus triporus]|uniref:Uncharacterized protein n=1 Tax=Stephanodiscus triporus TaxID=2934178 RepID=A0ABD3P2V7_9STRA
MDKVCYHINQIRMHLIRSKDDLMDEELFPANYSISKADECEEDNEEEEQAIPAFTAEEEDLDVYEVDDEWGTLVTDETKGIFTPILDAIAKRTPKMLHDFAWLAFVCSIRPDIVDDAKVRIVGNGPVRIMIEDCTFSHDVDGELDGTIDRKIDLFWDELTHFQNRTGPFARQAWFNSSDCINGRSAVWHSKYSRNHTQVFGPIACHTTAKITGSGGAEQGGSDKRRHALHFRLQPTFVELASRGMSWRNPIVTLPMPSGVMTMSNLIWD